MDDGTALGATQSILFPPQLFYISVSGIKFTKKKGKKREEREEKKAK